MKRRRLLWSGVLMLVLLPALVLALCLNPQLQTWAAHKFLASRPEMSLRLGRVAVGLGSARVEGLCFERPGCRIEAPLVEAQVSLWDALRGRLDLRTLTARGWVVDLRGQPGAEGKALPAPGLESEQASAGMSGVFSLARLPLDLEVGRIELEGELVAPAAEAGRELRGRVKLQGGGLGQGREGDLTALLALDPGLGEAISSMTAEARLSLGMDTPRSFNALGCRLRVEARGTRFPRGAQLDFDSMATRLADGERHELTLKRGGHSLLSLAATLGEKGSRLAGTWALDAEDGDLEPFALGFALPAFKAAGSGSFVARPAAGLLDLSGGLEGDFSRLELLDTRLAALGPVRGRTAFDLHLQGERLKVGTLRLELANAAGPVADVEALQAFTLTPASGAVEASDPLSALLRLRLVALPLSWVSPFVDDARLTGGKAAGEWTVYAHEGGFGLQTTRDLLVTGLGLERRGGELLRDLSLGAAFRADRTQEGWQLELFRLRLARDGARLAELRLRMGQREGGRSPFVVQGRLEAELPALFAQPLCAGLRGPEQGRLSAEFQGSLAELAEFHGTLKLAGLQGAGALLPSAELELRGSLAKDGTLTLAAPLRVENRQSTQVSDLALEGTFALSSTPLRVDASLKAAQVHVEDLRALAGAVVPAGAEGEGKPAPGSPSSAAAPVRAAPDRTPAWAVVEGRIQLAAGRIVAGPSLELHELRAGLEVSGKELRVRELRARGEEGTTLALDAVLGFEGGDRPYALQARLNAKAFDVSGLTGAGEGKFSPAVAGKFDLEGAFGGAGATLEDLALRSAGRLQLLSRGGKFRLLRSDISDFLQGRSGLGALVMGGLGSLLPSKKSDKEQGGIDEHGRLAMEIADFFAEIPYDQMSLVLVRDQSLDYRLEDLSLISPQVRLMGAGALRHKPGAGFASSPMELELKLATRGRMAELFGKAGLLQETKDNLGYLPLRRDLKVKGSLMNPDSSEFRDLLRGIALQKLGELLKKGAE